LRMVSTSGSSGMINLMILLMKYQAMLEMWILVNFYSTQ
jgi:hypothetical protein